VASVVSEVLVVICGVALLPRGMFDAALRRTLFFALLSGLAMVAVARLLHALSPFVAAPIAVLAYAGGLWVTGQIDRTHVAKLTGVVRRKFARAN
jgi:cytochrome b subunit of formate dehydrogenase